MALNLIPVPGTPGGRLGIMAHPRGGDGLPEEIAALRRAGVDDLVCLLTDREIADLQLSEEGALATAAGIAFQRFPIPDRETPPANGATTGFIAAVAGLVAAGRSVAIHCWVGQGRSALIGASALVLLGYPADEAFAALAAARGMPVPDTPEQRAWVQRFARPAL